MSDIKVLRTELATTERNLRVALAATLREHAQLLELFVAHEQPTLILPFGNFHIGAHCKFRGQARPWRHDLGPPPNQAEVTLAL